MTNKEKAEMWRHFDRMQKILMSDITTKKEFFAEPEEEQVEFYNWMKQQYR